MSGPDGPGPDLALPRDFGAHYGEGVRRGLCLGGGGLFFIAWQVSYLQGLAERGVDPGEADRVVGTSAGSVVASVLVGGGIRRLGAELSLLSGAPRLLSLLAPTARLAPSQLRALELFREATEASPATVRAIGHAALAATTPSPERMRRTLGVVLGRRRWPGNALQITCTDAYSAERCVVVAGSGVPITRAAAASSAVPGLFPPQPVGDRRCMDGGTSGTGTHLDLLAGARRVMVLGLSDGTDLGEGMLTSPADGPRRELADLEASGSTVAFRTPKEVDPEALMSPTVVPGALVMGRDQAAADAEELRQFWR